MSDLRDPNGRLGDLARHVIAELDEIQADYLTSRVPITSSEILGRTPLIGVEEQVALMREAADKLAARLDGYTEMPDAKTARAMFAGMPADLMAALRNPSIVLDRDKEVRCADGRTLHEHLEEWRNAPSNTASAHIETSEVQDAEGNWIDPDDPGEGRTL